MFEISSAEIAGKCGNTRAISAEFVLLFCA